MGANIAHLCYRNDLLGCTEAKCLIWTAEILMHALDVCDDERLKLALNLAFSCSLRIGELLGLTWDCVDITDEAIEEGRAYIYVDKEVQKTLDYILQIAFRILR